MHPLLVALLAAWPPAIDAGAEAYSNPQNWPNDPDWAQAWPLFGFTPDHWALPAPERDAGAGMGVDRAWSFSRGRPEVVVAVAGRAFDLTEPAAQHALALNRGELPAPIGADGGTGEDLDGDGRFDVGDFADDPRVGDRNRSGSVDVEDLIAAFADGQDSDHDGLADNICGWNFASAGPLTSTPDAGTDSPLTWLVGAVNDGRPGLGVCPGCTALPFAVNEDPKVVAAALHWARGRGARVILLEPVLAMSRALDTELSLADDAGVVVIAPTPPSLTWRQDPLSSHPLVLGVRTLWPDDDAPERARTLRNRDGCGGRSISATASVAVPRGRCGRDAALLVAGAAGLLSSIEPVPANVLRALLSGPRSQVGAAAERIANGNVPRAGFVSPAPFTLSQRGLLPLSVWGTAEVTAAEGTGAKALLPVTLDGGVGFVDLRSPRVDGGLTADANANTVSITARLPGLEWHRVAFATLQATAVEELRESGLGAVPPRFLDVDDDGSDELFLFESGGEVRVRGASGDRGGPRLRGTLAHTPAFIDLDGNGARDLVSVSIDGVVDAQTLDGHTLPGFPVELGEAVPGSLAAGRSFFGPALVVVTRSGAVHQLDERGRATEGFPVAVGRAQVSSPVFADFDRDGWLDIAVANGAHLTVLLTDSNGVAVRLEAASTARQVVAGDLIGDSRLELVADGVFDFQAQPLLAFRGLGQSEGTPMVVDLDGDGRRDVVALDRTLSGERRVLLFKASETLARGLRELEPEVLLRLRDDHSGAMVAGDVDGDGLVDALVGTADYQLLGVNARGVPLGRELLAGGSVSASPALGLLGNSVSIAAVISTGQARRWTAEGRAESIAWDGHMHDPWNSGSSSTRLPVRRGGQAGGGTLAPDQPPTRRCGCVSTGLVDITVLVLPTLVAQLHRRRRPGVQRHPESC